MADVKEEIEQLAKTMKTGIKVGADGICEVDPGLFEKTLEGTNIKLEDVTAIQKHVSAVAAGFALAVGERGLEAMKKNKEVDSVDGELAVGKDRLSVIFDRSREVIDPIETKNTGATVKKTVYGTTSMNYSVMGASTSRGQVKAVKDMLRERATSAFGN